MLKLSQPKAQRLFMVTLVPAAGFVKYVPYAAETVTLAFVAA